MKEVIITVAFILAGLLATFVSMIVYFIIWPDQSRKENIDTNAPVLTGSIEVIAPGKGRRVTGLK